MTSGLYHSFHWSGFQQKGIKSLLIVYITNSPSTLSIYLFQ